MTNHFIKDFSIVIQLGWKFHFAHIRIVLLKFRNGEVISTHTLLGMWLLSHAGININPC